MSGRTREYVGCDTKSPDVKYAFYNGEKDRVYGAVAEGERGGEGGGEGERKRCLTLLFCHVGLWLPTGPVKALHHVRHTDRHPAESSALCGG